jgi:hypothetical protein
MQRKLRSVEALDEARVQALLPGGADEPATSLEFDPDPDTAAG